MTTDSNKSLPTKDEYIKRKDTIINSSGWSEPKFKCDDCGGNVRKDNTIVLATFPPVYRYVCENCGKEYELRF